MKPAIIKVSTGFVLTVLFLSIVIISAWFSLSQIKYESQKSIRESLHTVLQTTHEALRIWIRYRKDNLVEIANEGEVIALTRALVSEYNNNRDIIKSPSLEKLRKVMAEKMNKYTDKGFFVIAPDRISIASMRDANIGSENLIHQNRKEYLDRVFAGETLFIPTIHSDVPLRTLSGELQARMPTIFVASPIPDDSGDVIAVLTIRLDPVSDFTRITQLGRIGDSGETYAFDHEGRLITESRFDNQLRRIGLINHGGKGMLSIRIADPGGNMLEGFIPTIPVEERPLTVMARSAISGKPGHNIDGYRDYRGVPVFGIWIWDEAMGFGLTTEIDTEEAMRPFYKTRITIILVLVTTIILSLGFLFLLLRLERASREKLKKAYTQLEEKVEERTREFKESEEKFRTIFESSADAMMLLDETGFIDCNEATLHIFRCKHKEEFLGKQPIKWSASTQLDGSECSSEQINGKIAVAFRKGQHAFEWNHIRADGEVFPAEVLLTPLWMNGKKIIQGTVRDISERKQAEEELASLHKELEQLSFLDGLTGIANRRMFDHTLDREWGRAQRNRQPLSLMLFDIDYFKQYNDHYGHQQGDNCLKEVANALTSVLKRAVDLVARYGGEEFVVLLPETDAKQAIRLAEKCRVKIIELQIPHESSKVSDVVTTSVGVSAIIPSAGTQPSSLIDASDKLLYKAKNNGRNRVEHA